MPDIVYQKFCSYYNELTRDSEGHIQYVGRTNEVIENLINDSDLKVYEYDNYIDYAYSINKNLYFSHNGTPIIKLPDSIKNTNYKYVTDILSEDFRNYFLPRNRIFLSAGTGRGKNTYIKEHLIKRAVNSGERVVIFENRSSLLSQQIQDIVNKFSPDALKLIDITKENMVTFGPYKNIMLISYQKAAAKCFYNDTDFIEWCNQARYLVFDEIHYILDDADFNKGICFFVNYFLTANNFTNATKLFLSGTMEEVFVYLQCLNSIKTMGNIEALKERFNDMTIEQKLQNANLTQNIINTMGGNVTCDFAMNMPTDYSYIIPCIYRELDNDIETAIKNNDSDDKWLIFVNSKKEGYSLLNKLRKSFSEDEVKFLTSGNRTDRENREVYDELLMNEKMKCRILISTTVIYNGVNIKDKKLKHIVLPFTTVPVIKQIIGRKRVDENENVKVYFPEIAERIVKEQLSKKLKEYFEVIDSSNPFKATEQANGLFSDKISKYICFACYQNGMINSFTNQAAAMKLHFDTMFYLFLLSKMRNGIRYTTVILNHLGIKNYVSEKIITKSSEEIKSEIKNEFEALLYKIYANPIIEESENSKYPEITKFEIAINELHRKLSKTDIDPHYKNESRRIPSSKINDFIKSVDLKYVVEYETDKDNKSKKTVYVKQLP